MSEYSDQFDKSVLERVNIRLVAARNALHANWTPDNYNELKLWEDIRASIKALKYKIKELENNES